MKLYVANCTKQINHFHYRVPEHTIIREQTIPPGGQIQVYGDGLDAGTIDYIVNQHAMYGLVAVEDIDRTKPFIGLCFSVDKPIDAAKITKAIRHNGDVLEERGHEQRIETAAAISSAAGEDADGAPTGLTGLSVETVEQQQVPTNDDEATAALIRETIKIDHNLPQARQTGKNASRGAQRGRGR